MDDTWVIQQQAHKQAFLDHINSIDPAIKFTVEGTQGNGDIPFLDTLVTPQADNSLSITVYCKPTHTDQYLQWDSHHSLSAKYNVIGTLTHRANTVYIGLGVLQRELQHLRKALVKCKYPHWAINRVQSKFLNSNWDDSSNNNLQDKATTLPTTWTNKHKLGTTTTISRPKSTIGYVVISYTQGLVESFKNICGKYGIQTYFKGNTTIKQVLMKPKDQDPKDKKSGVIYSFQCNDIACNEEYMGRQQGPLGRETRSTLANPVLSMCIYSKQGTTLQTYIHIFGIWGVYVLLAHVW